MEVRFSRLKKSLLVIAICCLVAIIITIGTRFWLSDELKKLNNDIDEAKQSLTSASDDNRDEIINKINDKILYLSNIQSGYTKWSEILAQVGMTVSDNIQLKNMQFDSQAQVFKIEGYAMTRDDLLAFKNSLEELPFLSQIASPISNLIKKEDVSFTLSGVFINPNTSDENI